MNVVYYGLSVGCALLLATLAHATPIGWTSGGVVCVQEVDGAPAACVSTIKVTNGALSCPGDGTCTITIAGGSGTPGGVSGNLQTNDGAGGFGAYGGTSCTAKPIEALSASGVATCGKVTLTEPAAGSTLTIADGKTLTASNTVTFTATDGSTVAFGAGGTAVYAARALTIAGTAAEITSSAGAQDLSADRTWTLSLPSLLTLSTKTLTGGSPLVFDGVTADANKTTLVITDPTAARTLTVPNADSVTVQPDTGAANNFLTAISTAGVISKAQPSDANLATTDITTNNVTSSKHGFAPKSGADATTFLNGAATPAYAAVKDSDLSTSDVTTNNVSTSKHGFAPKSPNDATKFLDGTGAYSVPAGGTGGTAGSPLFVQTATATAVTGNSETTILGTGVGSLTIPATWFTAAGTVLDIRTSGKYSTGAVPGTLQLKLKFGSTVVGQTAAFTPLVSVTDGVYVLTARLIARTVGASGTIFVVDGVLNSGTTLTPAYTAFTNPTLGTAVTIDTTATNVVDLTATWSLAATNSITGMTFEMVGPGSAVSSVNGQTGATSTRRVTTLSTSSTYTCPRDTSDQCEMQMTGGAGTLTVAAPSGTPINGDLLMLGFLCTNAQTFSWNSIFLASPNVALPTTCPADTAKFTQVGARYSTVLTKWQVIATN